MILKKPRYEVYYEGKATGIITKEKSVTLTELRKVVPGASPIGNIKFIKVNTEELKK